MEIRQITKYSDLVKSPLFEGANKVDLANVLNKPIIIFDFKAMPSILFFDDKDQADGKKKEFVVILAEFEGVKIQFNCGEVVLKQLERCKDKLPIEAVITREKGKRYYTLS